MEVDIRLSCADVPWTDVVTILKSAGMAYATPEVHQQAFAASFATVFAWHTRQLIGFGRAISDGVYQAALYDVAVLPPYQGKGVGATIVQHLLAKLPGCNVILYASPGKEGFYATLGFRPMKTGMALFKNPEQMAARGFTS